MDIIYAGYLGIKRNGPFQSQISEDPEDCSVASIFEAFCREFYNYTGWRYGGGTRIVLLNATLLDDKVDFDLDSVLSLCFEEAMESKAITDPDIFMHQLIQVAEKGGTASDFSNQQAAVLLRGALLSGLLALTPEPIRGKLSAAFQVLTRRITKPPVE